MAWLFPGNQPFRLWDSIFHLGVLRISKKKKHSDYMVYLISGRTGAGKTTIAKQMQSDLKAFRVSHDELLVTVYGGQINDSDFKVYCERINQLVWLMVEQAFLCGIDVILEGWGTRDLRDQARSRLTRLGAEHEFIYIECDRDTRFRRVMRRNVALANEGFHISEEHFHRMEELREEFDADEQCTVINNQDA